MASFSLLVLHFIICRKLSEGTTRDPYQPHASRGARIEYLWKAAGLISQCHHFANRADGDYVTIRLPAKRLAFLCEMLARDTSMAMQEINREPAD